MNITPPAQRKIQDIIQGKYALRVFIEGGGCSGFQYGFEIAEEMEDDDLMFGDEDSKILVDPLSYQYLSQAEVDYVQDLMGSRFVINNPEAKTTCGCGASFSMA